MNTTQGEVAPIPIYEQAASPMSPEAQAAIEVVQPCLRATERAETLFGQSLPRNTENRVEVELPDDVILTSSFGGLTADQIADRVLNAQRIITPAEEMAFYSIGAEVGIGRSEDITLQDAGLPLDALQVCQGGRVDTKGKSQKSLALGEDLTLLDDPTVAHKPTGKIVQCATKHRKLTEKNGELEAVAALFDGLEGENAERKERLLNNLGIDPAFPQTEWDGMVMMWVTDPSFEPNDDEQGLYVTSLDVNGKESITDKNGNLVSIGSIHGRQVFIQEVPRANKIGPDGQVVLSKRSRNAEYVQPNAATLALALARYLGSENAAVVTGVTYVLEEIVEAATVTYDMARAGSNNLTVRPIAYGTDRMDAITGKKSQKPSLAHLLGALGKAQRQAAEVIQRVTIELWA